MSKTKSLRRTIRILMAATVSLLLGVIALTVYGLYLDKKKYERKTNALTQALEDVRTTTQRLETKMAEEQQQLNAPRQTPSTLLEALRQELAEKERALRLAISQTQARDLAEVKALRAHIKTLEQGESFAENVIRKFEGGVCLIQGSFGFTEKESGRLLRFQGLDSEGVPLRGRDGNPLLTLEGNGPIVTVEYTGTGFLVDPKGLILTNRHIIEPWAEDKLSQQLSTLGYEPKRVLFRAFFPKARRSFGLRVVKASEEADTALLKIDLRGIKLPVLPLARTGKGVAAGQPVVLIGYPAGLSLLMAKMDDKTSAEILQSTEAESEQMAQELAKRGLIRPIATQGHLSNILPKQIIYDAQTTVGGSGAPIFNNKGEVIGINYAMLKDFSGSNFGVPIQYGLKLLKEVNRTDEGISSKEDESHEKLSQYIEHDS